MAFCGGAARRGGGTGGVGAPPTDVGQGQQVTDYLRASLIIFSMVSSIFLT